MMYRFTPLPPAPPPHAGEGGIFGNLVYAGGVAPAYTKFPNSLPIPLREGGSDANLRHQAFGDEAEGDR